MSEPNLYAETVPEAAIAYGNKSFVDDFSIGEPEDEVWNRSNRLPQKLRKVSKDIYSLTAVRQEGCKIFIPHKDDPFTQVDLLDSEEDMVKELIFRIRSSKSISYWQSLANRLSRLFYDAKEEDTLSPGIVAGSLRNFYKFILLHTDLKCPAISLTPDHTIYASWRGEQKRVFSVHFLPNGDARFVIFMPNVRHPERQIRLLGTVTTDILLETVASYHVYNWIS